MKSSFLYNRESKVTLDNAKSTVIEIICSLKTVRNEKLKASLLSWFIEQIGLARTPHRRRVDDENDMARSHVTRPEMASKVVNQLPHLGKRDLHISHIYSRYNHVLLLV